MKKMVFLSFFLLSAGLFSATVLEFKALSPGATGSILEAKGFLNGQEVLLNCDFAKDPSRYEKKYSGLKSSKGGHSLQLVCYNTRGEFLKFWMMGITSVGILEGLKSSKNLNQTPYVTLYFGSRDQVLKEKAQSPENTELTVNLVKYELDQVKGEAFIQGTLFSDWGEKGQIKAFFHVRIQDVGLTVR